LETGGAPTNRIDAGLVNNPDQHWLYLVGRLKPGDSISQAQVRLTAALQNWMLSREGSNVSAEALQIIKGTYVRLTHAGGGRWPHEARLFRDLMAVARNLRVGFAHHVRKHCKSPSCARDSPSGGRLGPACPWRKPLAAGSAVTHRKPDACNCRWNARASGRLYRSTIIDQPVLRRR